MGLQKSSVRLNDLNLFCFGLGDTAQNLRLLVPSVMGTSRTGKDGALLLTDATSVKKSLQQATHVLVSIPPIGSQDIVLEHYLKFLKNLPHLQWVGYLSATSVYGDHQGEWIDENSLCIPTTASGKKRLKIENEWLASGLPIHIFRLSGIYGKGRSVFNRLALGSANRLHKPGHHFSRVHVEDIALILKASMLNITPGEIFNVADDLPAEPRFPIEYACSLLKKELPPLIPFDEANLSKRMQEFYQDNKKVSNEKVKKHLNIDLKYPTYKEGLKAIFEATLSSAI